MAHPPTVASGTDWLAGAGRGALLWVLMTVAMMLPLAIPGLRYVARMTPRRGQLVATSTFAAAFVLAWLPGAVLAAGVHAGTSPRWPVVAAAFLGAAGWELAPAKRTALLRGHRHHVVRAQQPARRRTCWSFGLRRGGWCVVSCGPAMLALMVAHHALVPLLVLGIGAAVQQLSADAHWHRSWSAAGLVTLAAAAPWLV
jgi:predicted metal-binding membrane protein